MVFELFKNALRAVVEYQGSSATNFPPVEAIVVNGKEDVTIRVRTVLCLYFQLFSL